MGWQGSSRWPLRFGRQVDAAQGEAKEARAALEASQRSWEAQRRMLVEDAEKLGARISDLEKQNSLLHNHLEQSSARLAALQHERLPPIPDVVGNLARHLPGRSSHQSHRLSALPCRGVMQEATVASNSDSALVEVVRYQRSQLEARGLRAAAAKKGRKAG